MKARGNDDTDLDPNESGAPRDRRAAERKTRPLVRVISGPHTMRFAVLGSRGRVLVGRDPDADLVLGYGSVSRHHFDLRHILPNRLMVEDLGSTNGTFLNGVKLARPTPVEAGDELTIGAHVLRVERCSLDEIASMADLVARLGDPPVDPSTGLLSRRHLDELVPRQLAMLVQSGIPCALVLVDIDTFKQVSSKPGPQVGAAAHKVLGRLVRESIRDQDRGIRVSEDAIAVVAPNSAEPQAIQLAQRLVAVVDGYDWDKLLRPPGLPDKDEAPPVLQVSIGVAAYEPGESMKAWVNRAARAVFVARQLGGGTVVPGSHVA